MLGVDVTLRTNAAVPEQLAPIDVPRRMRVLVPIHEQTVRTAEVAVAVRATVGRVVAEQSMIFGPGFGIHGADEQSRRGRAGAGVDVRRRCGDAPYADGRSWW